MKNKTRKNVAITIAMIMLLSVIPVMPVMSAAEEQEQPVEVEGLSVSSALAQIDLIIIAPNEFCTALQPLKKHKDDTGINTQIVPLENIYKNYQGWDEPEKVKKCIARYRENHKIKYVMLVGDCDKFPVRYVKAYNTEWGSKYYPSDLYYADLYDSALNFDDWDYDKDHIFGEMGFDDFKEKDLNKLNLDRINIVS